MLSGSTPPSRGSRDLSIDWLRGLAMACVIVNHSRMSSLLTWFSYERFWVVTAAEVFVVLSGTVLGMVYGRRLARDGWVVVAQRLGRRALILYLAFIAVTLSVVLIPLAGIDVHSITAAPDRVAEWPFDPRHMDVAAWRDLLLMRHGPWPFEIVGLYVWLVAAAVPCLIALRFVGWRPLLAASWALYLGYRIAPLRVTSASFEAVFPILAWQLLFVHGIAIGYHRDRVAACAAQLRRRAAIPVAGAAVLFALFALCNPWTEGPAWLRWTLVSPERFADLYARYFDLTNLGVGRLLNLAVGLPLGYAALTWSWTIVRPLHFVFVTLGQRSLGAFVLHVYGMLLLQQIPHGDSLVTHTLLQVALILTIALFLNGMERVRASRGARAIPQVQPAAA